MIVVAFAVVSAVGVAQERGDLRQPAKDRRTGGEAGEALEESLNAQLDMLSEMDGQRVSFDRLRQLAPDVYELLAERMLACAEPGSPLHSGVLDEEDRSSALTAVRTKGGLIYVLDRGDGVVHLLAFALDRGQTYVQDMEQMALNVAIDEQGAEIVDIDSDQLARFLRTDGKRGGLAPGPLVGVDEGLLEAQMQAVSDCGEPVPFESLQEWAPDLLRLFFASAIAQGDGRAFERNSPRALHVLRTSGGFICVVDFGDGVVHILAFAAEHGKQYLGPEDMDQVALNAAITGEGFEIVQMDQDQMGRFVVSGGRDVRSGATAALDVVGDPGGPNDALDVDMDCHWTGTGVCCAIATDKMFCYCCGTISPLRAGCAHTPLQ